MRENAAKEWHDDDIPDPDDGPNGNTQKMDPLSLRRSFDILAMEFSDDDFIFKNGYLAKGDPLGICGAPGVGKSRLCLQLIIATITGRDFLGWPTNGKGSHWLFLQTENVCRRLKSDLAAMFSALSSSEKHLVNDCLLIHTLETGDDSFLHLNVPENQERVAKAIDQRPWTGVFFDVLRDFSVDDLNTDHGMQETLAIIGRLTRKKNPHCIPGIIHHARTGKAGASSATGFDRGSFGRNSKVFLSWVRSQINVAPYEGDNNEVLIIASGKCNNAEEFSPFAVRLNFKTKMYERDDSIDIEEWKERIGAETTTRDKRKKIPADLKALVPVAGAIPKNALLGKATVAGIGTNTAKDFLHVLIDEGELFEWPIKRSGTRPEVHISRHEQSLL